MSIDIVHMTQESIERNDDLLTGLCIIIGFYLIGTVVNATLKLFMR